MSRRKVLVQWIGNSDLRAMLQDSVGLSKAKRSALLKDVGVGPVAGGSKYGPTKTLLDQVKFDEVRLLSNYKKEWNTLFAKWVGSKVKVISVSLENPADHSALMQIAEKQLADAISQGPKQSSVELYIHLSPGTPAMHAVWLLLGKTRYPAKFYETYRNKWSVPTIPFDIVSVIPDVLKDPDVHLQHLASEAPGQVKGFEKIIGTSPAIRTAVGAAKRTALRSISTLLLGESGSGKELFARAIHDASTRKSGPFISVNCAAFAKSSLESELFGHVKGAYTDAKEEREGAFQTAHTGTIFLDEVGECDLKVQAKLLRVLQPLADEGTSIREFTKLGDKANKVQRVNVRVIAATNRDIHQAIAEGKFREDLLYRLAAVTINLPPLRERRSDIRNIAEHLLSTLNEQFSDEEPGYVKKKFSPSAVEFIKGQNWPGNVRQLYNCIVQAAVFSDGDKIGRQELQVAVGDLGSLPGAEMTEVSLGNGFNLKDHLDSIEGPLLRRAMQESHGNRAEATRLLGLSGYQTLDGKLNRLDIPLDFGKPRR